MTESTAGSVSQLMILSDCLVYKTCVSYILPQENLEHFTKT